MEAARSSESSMKFYQALDAIAYLKTMLFIDNIS
jgi:hypothetical protein